MKKQRSARPKPGASDRKRHGHTDLWALAANQSVEFMALIDPDGRFLAVNRAFLTALGRSESQIVGQHFSSVFAPRNPPALVREIGERTLQGDGWRGECQLARADGTVLDILLSAGPVNDAGGRRAGGFVVGHDIGERKRIEEALRKSEELLRQLAENMREVFFTLEVDPPRTSYITRAYEQIWGRTREDLYRNPAEWMDSVYADDQPLVSRVFTQCLTGVPTDMEYRLVRPDNTIRWIHARTFPATDVDGRLVRIVGIAEDVTKQKLDVLARREAHGKLDHALREAEKRAREEVKLTEVIEVLQSCHNLDEAYGVLGSTLPSILPVPAGALYLTSQSRDAVEAVVTWGPSSPTARAFPLDGCWALRRGRMHVVEDAASPMRCAHVTSAPQHGYVCVPLAAQSESLGVLYLEGGPAASADALPATLTALGDQASALGERLSLALANLRLRDVLRWQSIRDPLTGLFNRRYMEESLDRELRRGERGGQAVSVLMLDIDHFKRFNDTFGHQAGDALLRAIGEFLLKHTRGEDVACRYGGEEFVIVMSGSTVEDASTLAESLRESVRHMVVPYAGQVLAKVALSIGVAGFPSHGDTSEALLHAADKALYRAKADGRNRVVVSP
jgi:diguanylate cyclase (GGDEF)-like protein/PAS domain S-box-containing protein